MSAGASAAEPPVRNGQNDPMRKGNGMDTPDDPTDNLSECVAMLGLALAILGAIGLFTVAVLFFS